MTTWIVWGSFLHGLVFVMLGLTVSFLHYRSRRIRLARHFPWLGIFAVCESLRTWDNLSATFIPDIWTIPPLLLPVISAVGYSFLLAFGLQLFMSDETQQKYYRHLILGPNLLWAIPYFYCFSVGIPQF